MKRSQSFRLPALLASVGLCAALLSRATLPANSANSTVCVASCNACFRDGCYLGAGQCAGQFRAAHYYQVLHRF